jgi:hypothetical protein
MAEFEELRLSVVLTDNATAGLTAIRQQITLLTQSASGAVDPLNRVAESAKRVGESTRGATPHVTSAEKAMKDLGRTTEAAARGVMQMALSVRGGIGALPQLALGLREATTGVSGMSEAMEKIAPASRASLMALAGVAVGVAAVGAAVAAYFISVFKFAREMKELNDSAKVLGMSLGQLKDAQDQARVFGIAAESIVQSFGAIQAAQVDLYQNNSQLRQRLIAIGTPAQWVNELMSADPVKAQNMAVQYARQIEQGFIKEGASKSIARGFANKFLAEFGLAARLMDMPLLKPMDPAMERKWKDIGETSDKISKVWGEIGEKLDRIKVAILMPGLPVVLEWLRTADRIMEDLAHWTEKIVEWWGKLPSWMTDPDLMGKFVGALRGAGVPEGPAKPPAPATQDPLQRMNYVPGGGSPLLQRASLELVDETEKNTSETTKLTDQLVKLNTFFDRAGGGSTTASAGGPPGVTQASFGGNAAGAAGVPWAGGDTGGGNAGTSPMGRTGAAAAGAQASADLSKPAYDQMFKGTPLEGKYDNVVAAAKANNVPPSLMAGIMAHETGKGTSAMLRDKNNPAGLMDPKTGSRTGMSFPNVDAGIEAAGRSIGKNYAAGGGSIEGMAKSYAPPGAANDPAGLNKGWPTGVASAQRQLSTGMEGQTAGGIPSQFQADLTAMTLAGAKPHNIRAYMQSRGINLSEATCGQFMAAVVKEHGGSPPKNPAIASNWNTFGGPGGAGYSSDPNAINVAVKQGVSTGSTGSHVTGAVPIMDESGKVVGFRGVGVNQGQGQGAERGVGQYGRDVISSKPLSIGTGRGQFQIRHQIPDRDVLDRSAVDRSNGGGNINSTGKLNIDINAPPGTKTQYEGTNLLKNYGMQRQTQMLPTSYGTPVDSPNLWE